MLKFMWRRRVAIIGAAVALGCAAPALAQLFPGVTIVNDPFNKVVLVQQLTQLEQQLQIAEANIKNIGSGGWGSTIQDVSQIDGELSSGGQTAGHMDPQSLRARTAAMQLQQLPGEESDLRYAQTLSDGAGGQLQATQASTRLQSITVGQMQKERELLLANTLQTEGDYQQTVVDLWAPSVLDGRL